MTFPETSSVGHNRAVGYTDVGLRLRRQELRRCGSRSSQQSQGHQQLGVDQLPGRPPDSGADGRRTPRQDRRRRPGHDGRASHATRRGGLMPLSVSICPIRLVPSGWPPSARTVHHSLPAAGRQVPGHSRVLARGRAQAHRCTVVISAQHEDQDDGRSSPGQLIKRDIKLTR